MTMDLRYYNEETGQWEVMFANATDLTKVATDSLSKIDFKPFEDKLNIQATQYGVDAIISVSDWNLITASGIYQGDGISGNVLNGPPVTDWFVGDYYAHNDKYGVMRVRALHDERIGYIRNKINNTWTPWVLDRVDNTISLTSVPLVNGFNSHRNSIKYGRYGNNLAFIVYHVSDIPNDVSPAMVIGAIPANYAPSYHTPVMGWATNMGPYASEPFCTLWITGELRVSYNARIGPATEAGIIGGMIYYAPNL